MRLQKLRNFLPPVSLKNWLYLAVPLSLSLSILASGGEYLQEGLIASLKNDAPSLYAGAFDQNFVQYPDLLDWIGGSINPTRVIASIFVVLAAFYFRTIFRASACIGVGYALALTINDIWIYFKSDAKGSELFESVAANVFAGVAVAAISVGILKVYVRVERPFGKNGKLIAFALSIITLSLVASSNLYLILYFFFQPTVVNLDARLAPPSGAFFISELDLPNAKTSDDADHPFSLIPRDATIRTAQLQYVGKQPQLAWSTQESKSRFRVKFTPIIDCTPNQSVEVLAKFPSVWQVDGVRSFKVSADFQMADVVIEGSKVNTVAVSPAGAGMFWLATDRSQIRGAATLQAFLQPPSSFAISGPKPMTFYLAGPLLNISKNKEMNVAAKSISINIDGKMSHIYAGGSRAPEHSTVKCHAVSLSELATGLPRALRLGVLVRVERVRRRDEFYRPVASRLEALNIAGNLSLSGVESSAEDSGIAKALSFRGRVPRMTIDGTEMKTEDSDRFDSLGKFSVRRIAGEYRISGPAKIFWHNMMRVNPTRWERSSAEIQVVVLSLFGFAILAIARYISKHFSMLKGDEELFLDL